MNKFFLSILSMLVLFLSIDVRASEKKYAAIKLEGSVNPIIAEHIVNSIKEAQEKGVQFIVIQMDTPGGLVTSMREIIKAILASKVPIIPIPKELRLLLRGDSSCSLLTSRLWHRGRRLGPCIRSAR